MTKYIFKHKRKLKDGKTKTARTYSGRYRLSGEFHTTTVCLGVTDKQAAEEKLNKIVREREQELLGIVAPKMQRDAAKKELALHLQEFLESLSLDCAPKYVRNMESRLQILKRECRWRFFAHVTADSFEEWRRKNSTKAIKTLNDYLDAARSFLNWLVKMKRLALNPLLHLEKLDGNGRQTRMRRALSQDAMMRLVSVAGERKIGYLFAVHSGLRRNELRTLVWADIHLDAEAPYVCVRRQYAKNRKEEPVALHTDLVFELRKMKTTDTKPSDAVLKPGMLPGMSKMKSDLKRAGIEFIENGKRADFHALRHTLATNCSLCGVPPRLAQGMMRHGDLRLTMQTYTDQSALSLASVVRMLPSFLGANAEGLKAGGDTLRDTQTTGSNGQAVTQSGNDASDAGVSKLSEGEGLWRELAQIDAIGLTSGMVHQVGLEPTTQ